MSSHSNVYVTGLPEGIDEESFKGLFDGYGSVVSVKLIAQNRYGFVKFETVEEAQNAVDELNGSSWGDATITVKFANNDQGEAGQKKGGGWAGGKGWITPHQPSAPPPGKGSWSKGGKAEAKGDGRPRDNPPCDQVYVKGLPLDFTDDQLFGVFGAYGSVVWHKVLQKPGADDTAALIQMSSVTEATWLVENLDGNIPQGLTDPVAVSFSSPPKSSKGGGKGAGKTARASPYGGGRSNDSQKGGGKGANIEAGDNSNLYIKGLPAETDELYLYKLFAPFGAITSVRAIVAEWGAIGFVKYAKVSEAQVALQNLTGQTLADGSIIQVSVKTAKKGGGKGSW